MSGQDRMGIFIDSKFDGPHHNQSSQYSIGLKVLKSKCHANHFPMQHISPSLNVDLSGVEIDQSYVWGISLPT